MTVSNFSRILVQNKTQNTLMQFLNVKLLQLDLLLSVCLTRAQDSAFREGSLIKGGGYQGIISSNIQSGKSTNFCLYLFRT